MCGGRVPESDEKREFAAGEKMNAIHFLVCVKTQKQAGECIATLNKLQGLRHGWRQ